ncbi:hypothetical protein D7Z26_24310 [Cohnella endophytica]|uniref:DUF4399 domain-containing protein n=2 Tax=Cohnella endophytica TaxID=2419778 RepID=A0A494XGR7_9BACL|nr:hypothetical protein D7Z26_24310 [Cohnella endophytica]
MLTACGGAKTTSGSRNGHAAHQPKMDVKLDVEGNQVTVNVITDMTISPEHYGMARHDMEGHIHMYLDNGDKIAVKEAHKTFPDLPPGKHTIKVSLHNNDHTPYDVTKTFDFEIK